MTNCICMCHDVVTSLIAVLIYTYVLWYYPWENLCKIGSSKGTLLFACRGGSLPEILNYLPDRGQFSWVPVLIQIQVKFLFPVRVIFEYFTYPGTYLMFLTKKVHFVRQITLGLNRSCCLLFCRGIHWKQIKSTAQQYFTLRIKTPIDCIRVIIRIRPLITDAQTNTLNW